MASSKLNSVILIALLAVLACSCLVEGANTHHTHPLLKRLARDSNKNDICSENTPCGWAVYTRFSRNVETYMKNTCSCSPDLECVRVDDDVSVSAYVYKCRTVPKDTGSKAD